MTAYPVIAYLALAVISAATLAYEVLLVRLFAIVQWHHFAFMAISIALLGFGASGTLLALWQAWARSRFTILFWISAMLFALSAPASFAIAQVLPFNPLAIVWEPAELLYLPVMSLLLVVPFFCGALCVCLAFVSFGDQIGRVYAFNLIGSAAGALGVVAALFVFSPMNVLWGVAVLGVLAAVCIALTERGSRRLALCFGPVILAIAGATMVPEGWLDLRISAYKGLPSALRVAGAKVVAERSSPLGLLTVVASPEVPFRYVPGLSLSAPPPPSRQLGVFIDGGGMTAITAFDGEVESLAYLDHTTDALAYHLVARPSVLVLGAGGGQSVLQALYHRAPRIDAVEVDANMVRLVGDDFAEQAGGIYGRPEVRAHVAEARAYVASSDQKWDLIQIPLLDSADAAAAGVPGLSESYLYTVEAFEEYLRHLRPDGWLGITRWLKLPPRDAPKLFATALASLEAQGVDAPEKRLMLLRGLTTSTLLVKNGEISADDIALARALAEARSFDLGYFPGMRADGANRFNVLDTPYFFDAASALIGEEADAFIAGYKFNIQPATDERPYFFDFFKWRTLPELLRLSNTGQAGLLELGRVILVATLVQAAVLGAVLILLPLWAKRRALLSSPHVGWVGGYFLALGLAFLFIEIAFIQKFLLFLGHPLYAVAVVLTAFLLFAGIGSGLSSRLAAHVDARQPRSIAIPLAVAAIIGLSMVYIWLLPPVFAALISLADGAKVIVSLALIAPLAFVMGLPFPLGLTRVQRVAPPLVPWAWGVNGCASVLSAMLATLIAMSFGFTAVVVAALVLYGAAALLFHWAPEG